VVDEPVRLDVASTLIALSCSQSGADRVRRQGRRRLRRRSG